MILSIRWGVLCICLRPFLVCPPSLRCGSRTAWLSWAGRLIGRGRAASPPVSGGVSPRRLEGVTDLLCPTREESSSSSPRPRPSREICSQELDQFKTNVEVKGCSSVIGHTVNKQTSLWGLKMKTFLIWTETNKCLQRNFFWYLLSFSLKRKSWFLKLNFSSCSVPSDKSHYLTRWSLSQFISRYYMSERG